MRILLIRPPDKMMERLSLGMPLGLAYLAASLRPKHQVSILDAPHRGMSIRDVARCVGKLRPDIVGFSTLTHSLYSTALTAREIKKVDSRILTVIGGPHISGDPEGTLRLCDEWDFGFHGEADIGFPLFVDRLAGGGSLNGIPGLIRRVDGRTEVTPACFVQDLDQLPSPAWDLLDIQSYPRIEYYYMGRRPNAHIFATRGCPEHCIFCGIRGVTGTGFRKRRLSAVMEEVRHLQATYGIKTLIFVDDNLTADREYALALFEELAALPQPLEWIPIHGIRLDTLDEEVVRAMARSGCIFFYAGIETGSQRILDRMHKGTTLEDIEARIAMVKRVSRIKVCGYFILGFPGETVSDTEQTIRFARQLKLDRALFLPNMMSPGSSQFQALKESGRLPVFRIEDFRNPIELGYRLVWDNLAERDGLSPKTLRKLFEKAYLSFYLDPRHLAQIPFRLSPRGLRNAVGYLSRYF